MRDKVIYTIERYNMISKGDGVVVGFSGGPDSLALLHVLWSLRRLYDIKIYAVHLNHMIRGEEAFRDEGFARSFAEQHDIPFFSRRIKVEDFAKQSGMSSEEAGRYLRYGLFNEIADEVGASKIAIAHNMNDQAETMIMRFFRGTGISGMVGIKPVRDNRYIRPIISCSRNEIEDYCRNNHLNPVIDSTNNEVIYSRNKIRNHVIPYIKDNFNKNIVEGLYRSSEILRDEDDYLNSRALIELEGIKIENGFSVKDFNMLHPALKRRIIRMLILRIKGDLIGIEIKHIDECIELIAKGHTGKTLNLPKELECKVEYELFKIQRKNIVMDYSYKLLIPGCTRVDEAGITICTSILEKSLQTFKDKQFIKYFDYDKIGNMVEVRNRRDGDFIFPKGMSGKKKLKEIFIDKKIPRDKRNRIPLVVFNNEVLWAFELRDSRNYKINENTKRILEIKIERGALDE